MDINVFKDLVREGKNERIIWRSKKFGFFMILKYVVFVEEILFGWKRIFYVMVLLFFYCVLNIWVLIYGLLKLGRLMLVG